MDVSEGAKGILEDLLAEVIAATNHRLASFGFPPGVGALAGSVALGVALNLRRRNNKIARESRRKNRGK